MPANDIAAEAFVFPLGMTDLFDLDPYAVDDAHSPIYSEQRYQRLRRRGNLCSADILKRCYPFWIEDAEEVAD